VLGFVTAAKVSFASAPYALSDSGNAAYKKGNYASATDFYLKFLNSGYESPDIYYNLGNCYYRTNDIAKAILYYEKAKRLAPEDADIQMNLQLANLKITDRIPPDAQLFFVSWWHNVVNMASERGWGVICIFLFCIFLGLIILYLTSQSLGLRKLGFWAGLLMLILCISAFMLARVQYDVMNTHDTAIIMSPTVTAKGSPADNGTQLFVVHEGTKVKIIKTEGSWTEVKLANGNQGWVATTDITPI
jgi:tetratricopeptide (TPR) repeat protein